MKINIRYENKYGTVELETVTDFIPVSRVNGDMCPEPLTLETLEKVALITDNIHIQSCLTKDLKRGYCIFHAASNIAAVCKVVHLDYKGMEPSQEILREYEQNKVREEMILQRRYYGS